MRRAAACLAVPLGATLLLGAAPAPSARPNPGVAVTVTVTDLRNAKGLVRACMTTDASDFPRCRDAANLHGASTPARAGSLSFTFENVQPGRYAIALLHDENGNGKADRALGMMPKEGFGFSRDAKVRMGPPKFSEAAFDIGTEDRALTIRMRYLL